MFGELRVGFRCLGVDLDTLDTVDEQTHLAPMLDGAKSRGRQLESKCGLGVPGAEGLR